MKATIYFKNNNLSEFGELGQFILAQLKNNKPGTFLLESSKVLNRNNLEFITSSLGNDIFFAGTSCENIDNIINKNLPENNNYCGYEVAIITIIERPNYWEVTYITHSSNMEYKFFVSDEFNVTELLYTGFSGTIFSHSLVEDVEFSKLIDIESTKKETVESNLFSNCKNLNIIDYLKMKLIYEEGQHRYNYYCPSSPLLYILENNIMKTTNLEKCNEMLIKYTSGECIYDEFIHFLKIEGLNQMNEFGSLTSEFSINWDKLECDPEGFTTKQEFEADSLIDDYSKQLLDINNIAHNIIIEL